MSTTRERIRSYVGFAIRATKIAFGVDDIVRARHVSVILYSDTLSPNSAKQLQTFSDTKTIKMIKLNDEDFAYYVGRPMVKAVGILQKSLSSAIITALEAEQK